MKLLSKIQKIVAPIFVVLNYQTNSETINLEQMQKTFISMKKKEIVTPTIQLRIDIKLTERNVRL